MVITETITQAIKTAVEKAGISYDGDLTLEHPRELSHGDYATNIAMMLAKAENKNPLELAEIIAKNINAPEIANIEVAGPGFINITLADEFYLSQVKEIFTNPDNYGWNTAWQGKKILVEHSSPNLFKPFHIGHMMNNTIGESMARLAHTSGAEVTVVSYPSDVSLGIGKAVWKLMDYGVEKLDEFETVAEKMAFLGRCYAEGTQAYDAAPELEARVREITQDIYEHRDTPAYAAYKIGRDLNLDYFLKMTARLGSSFDGLIFESEAGIAGKEIVMNHVPDVYTESNGAVIYEGEQDGLHTRVFINKDGNPTYEAKDIGLLKLKFERYQPDLSVLVTDSEQKEYYKVVKTSAGKINADWDEKMVHKTHGRMQFKGTKMSSRLGNTPLVADILDAVVEEVNERADGRTLTPDEADVIAIAAIKYTILRTQAGKNINFDPDTSLSFEGDSGPYLQYTYARAQSVLDKASHLDLEPQLEQPDGWQVTDLERYLYRFPEIVDLAFRDLAPHQVVTYVTELAQMFNTWYGNTKIVDQDDPATLYRLALTKATGQVIKNGLWILGIDALEQM
ncbi:arginine--tRNA ligase [Patescibacteria group bacterium]|nr:arginine--tRNA ligase [Patescibacteria group bacterium]